MSVNASEANPPTELPASSGTWEGFGRASKTLPSHVDMQQKLQAAVVHLAEASALQETRRMAASEVKGLLGLLDGDISPWDQAK